ncbi:YbdD/YjiX family protein [Neomicrococcus lactis]
MSVGEMFRGSTTSLKAGAKALSGYFEGVLTGDKYKGYLEHHAKSHPGEEPMTEKQWWRDYNKWQDDNPQGRCC